MTIISGMAMPATAKMMWNINDIAICERAASKSLISSAPTQRVFFVNRGGKAIDIFFSEAGLTGL
jgi:hypothetical protein